MDATILVNRIHRLPRNAIPQTLVEPEIIFDAPVGDRKRLLAVNAAKAVEELFARGKEGRNISVWGVRLPKLRKTGRTLPEEIT